MVRQTQNYEAAHMAGAGGERIRPAVLRALYEVDPTPPKPHVLLFDDVLSARCHFKAAQAAILSQAPGRQGGWFLPRAPGITGSRRGVWDGFEQWRSPSFARRMGRKRPAVT
jgi:hypothetical protein